MVKCNCRYWIENVSKIDGALDIANVHGFTYNIKPFLYCPWCGASLRTFTNEKEKVQDYMCGGGITYGAYDYKEDH